MSRNFYYVSITLLLFTCKQVKNEEMNYLEYEEIEKNKGKKNNDNKKLG